MIESASAAVRLRAARAFVEGVPPMTEVLLVGASRGSVDDLARAIAADRAVVVGLHRFSFTQLAARLAATVLAGRGLTPGSTLGADAVAARAAFEAQKQHELTYFAPVAGMPGFPRALARTLHELRLAGVGAAALAALPSGGADLAQLLDRFDAQFAAASATDRAALLEAAVAALRGGRTPWSGHPLLLLDVPVDSAVERDFIAALLASSASALATVPFGDLPALDALQSLGGQLEVREDLRHGVLNSDLAALRRHVFARTQPPARDPAGDVRFFSAPGEAREAIEIARRALEEARRGVRFDEMAIFIRAPQHYLGLLEHALQRAGVPAHFDRGTRRPHPAGRAFLAILACAVEKLSARRFAEYLSLGQVPLLNPAGVGIRHAADDWVAPDDEALAAMARLDAAPPDDAALDAVVRLEEDSPARAAGGERGEAAPATLRRAQGRPELRRRASAGERGWGPASDEQSNSDDSAVVEGTLRAPWKWESLLVESSVIGETSDRWHRRLDGLANEYRIQIRELRKDDPDSPKLGRLERDLRNLKHLREFALPIVDRLASWPQTATWAEWLERFEALAPIVLRRPAHVLRVLGALKPMGEIGPIALKEARDVLADRLLTLEIDPPARRYGRVFVGSPHQARGRAFRVVFVPGLAERMFPQKPREDAMLLDDERRTLGAALTLQDDRAQTERLLLRLAVGAATERVHLSYPRLEIAEGRPRVPSFYALDVMRAITGHIPNHEDLMRAAAEEGGARLAWPAPADPARALDDVEHDLAVLRGLLDAADPAAVRGHAHYLLRLNDCLRRSITTRWARARSLWSHHDGIVRVTGQTSARLAAERLGARPYSLSALQKFSSCPYQFLLAAIYRLEPAEEPEPLQRLDPLTRGSIFHSIQTEFFRVLERRTLEPGTAGAETMLAVLDQTIERVAEDYRELLAPAIDRVWRDEIADIGKDLRVWVRALPDPDGWQPYRFEFSFGLRDDSGDVGRDPRSLPDPVRIDGRFLLRGAVDLLEQRHGGTALRVTDHKTGRARMSEKSVIDGGRALQPVLYGLAIEAALGVEVTSGRLYYCTSAGGFRSHEIPLNDRSRRAGMEALEIVDRAVELGCLPPAPADRACAWCDFRPVCGPHEEKRLKHKSPDLIADLLALRLMP